MTLPSPELQAVHTNDGIVWYPKTDRDRKVDATMERVAREIELEEVGAQKVAPGVYRLEDEHHVYAVPSSSTNRLHQVTVNTRTGAMRCDGPRCDGRTCSHQRRVLAARAGF